MEELIEKWAKKIRDMSYTCGAEGTVHEYGGETIAIEDVRQLLRELIGELRHEGIVA